MSYEIAVSNLMKDLPFIKAVAITEESTDITFSIGKWNLEDDIR